MRGPSRTLARLLVAALALTLLAPATLALTLLAPATLALAGEQTGPCDLKREADETTRGKMRRIIQCAAGLWEVPGGAERAICVADAESDLNPRATSAGGDFLGLFQHVATTWPDRFDTWTQRRWNLNDSALSGRSNAIVTIRMVNAEGWGPWRGAGDCFDPASQVRTALG